MVSLAWRGVVRSEVAGMCKFTCRKFLGPAHVAETWTPCTGSRRTTCRQLPFIFLSWYNTPGRLPADPPLVRGLPTLRLTLPASHHTAAVRAPPSYTQQQPHVRPLGAALVPSSSVQSCERQDVPWWRRHHGELLRPAGGPHPLGGALRSGGCCQRQGCWPTQARRACLGNAGTAWRC